MMSSQTIPTNALAPSWFTGYIWQQKFVCWENVIYSAKNSEQSFHKPVQSRDGVNRLESASGRHNIDAATAVRLDVDVEVWIPIFYNHDEPGPVLH